MMVRLNLILGLLLILAAPTAGLAQPPNRSRNSAASGMQALRDRFNQNSPAIGKPLPDVTVFDAEGKKFAIKDLRGKHTVLVFGCLT